jgi:hypothetical protein
VKRALPKTPPFPEVVVSWHPLLPAPLPRVTPPPPRPAPRERVVVTSSAERRDSLSPSHISVAPPARPAAIVPTRRGARPARVCVLLLVIAGELAYGYGRDDLLGGGRVPRFIEQMRGVATEVIETARSTSTGTREPSGASL